MKKPLTRTVEINGSKIVITITPILNAWGMKNGSLLWSASNNYGEPKCTTKYFDSAADALRNEVKEIASMFGWDFSVVWSTLKITR